MTDQLLSEFTDGQDYNIIQPYRIRGKIVHGFKRGSTQLGFPTANVDPNAFSSILDGAKHGVYFGWAQVLPFPQTSASTTESSAATEPIETLQCEDFGVFKCMLSLGKNVQFDATQDTLEAYIHHTFLNNFYDHEIELIICGYIRPQLSFETLDALITAIKRDVAIGEDVLDHNTHLSNLQTDPFFIHTTAE